MSRRTPTPTGTKIIHWKSSNNQVSESIPDFSTLIHLHCFLFQIIIFKWTEARKQLRRHDPVQTAFGNIVVCPFLRNRWNCELLSYPSYQTNNNDNINRSRRSSSSSSTLRRATTRKGILNFTAFAVTPPSRIWPISSYYRNLTQTMPHYCIGYKNVANFIHPSEKRIIFWIRAEFLFPYHWRQLEWQCRAAVIEMGRTRHG